MTMSFSLLLQRLLAKCRSLELRESDPVLLQLAPDTLRLLCFEPPYAQLDPAIFRTMSSVNKLELINNALDVKADMTPLQSLPLEELVLINCPNAASAILAPGVLRGVKRLLIDSCEREHTVRSYSSDSDGSDSNDSNSDDHDSEDPDSGDSDSSDMSSSDGSSSESTSRDGNTVV